MHIYLIQNLETSKYKIGVSKNPKKRLKQLQTGSGEEIKLIHEFKSNFPRKVETALHNRYGHLKAHGEWFSLTLSEEVVFIEECTRIEKNISYLKERGNIFL